MIILKATQDMVLSALQSMAAIVERRHSLAWQCSEGAVEDYEPNKVARTVADFFRPPTTASQKTTTSKNAIWAVVIHGICHGLAGVQSAVAGFFSASKANLRNAP